MGRIGKGQPCDLCSNPAVRSLSIKDAMRAFSELKKLKSGRRRVYVCKEHYKAFKKRVKDERKIELWRIR